MIEKKIRYALIILLVLMILVFFSPLIGLGENENFILYRLFKLMRSSVFTILFSITRYLILSYIIVRILPLIKNQLDSDRTFENRVNIIIILNLFIYSCALYCITKSFDPFRWSSYTNFSALVHHSYNNVLQNDFYTNAIIQTPRRFIQYLLLLPTKLGVSWFTSVSIFFTLVKIIYIPMIFLCFDNIIKKFNKNSNEKSKILLMKFFLIITVLSGVLIKLQSEQLIGWPSIFRYLQASGDHLTAIIGLFYIYFSFSLESKQKKMICRILLFICTLLHIVISGALFSIVHIYKISLNDINIKKDILEDFFYSFFIPSSILYILFGNSGTLPAEKFIDIYVYQSHYFHYKISDLINPYYFIWLFGYIIHFIISIVFKNKSIFKLSILSIAFYTLPPLIHFLGTEVMKIKIIGILGINRFIQFNTFIFILNSFIIFRRSKLFHIVHNYITKNISFHYNKHELYFYSSVKKLTDRVLKKKKFVYLVMFLVMVFISKTTLVSPLHNNPNYNGVEELCEWLNKNTSPYNTVILVYETNMLKITDISTAIKCFGQRATFVDMCFPFNESYIIEWNERKNVLSRFNKISNTEFQQLKKTFSVTHILMPNNKINRFDSSNYLWKNNNFILFDINTLI